jgi:hypothetical protein
MVLREIGTALIVFGALLLVLFIWGQKDSTKFILELILGSVFIYAGLQLIK